ncbi:hypothetical protein SCACP_13330 [Sporomusa carbonis]|uniref:OadG family protein n=1 Tax=Sporomusa carbonis TaxID=3076075 RepID=UPI003A70111F
MDQPVTTNPILISLINMTVVFAVLYGLSLIVRLIRVIDPTQKKNVAKTESPAVAAPVATAPAELEIAASYQDENEVIAVIAAAIAAYGFSASQIVSIRPVGGKAWAQAARLEAVNARNQMF